RPGDRLDRRSAEAAPARPPPLRARQQRQPQLQRQTGQRRLDTRPPARPGRPEGHELVLVAARLGEAGEHPAQVVADPRAGPRERADVDNNSHKNAEYPARVAVDTAAQRAPLLPSLGRLSGYGELLRTLIRREIRVRYKA